MEFKWLMIGFSLVMASLAASDAVHKYSRNQCSIAYASSSKSATEIKEICK